MLTEGYQSERVEASDQEVQGFISEEVRTQIKIGKMSLALKQIKEAAEALNLRVLENEVVNGVKEDQSKMGRTLARRKGGMRELRNLECSIDFDKGRKDKGLRDNL